jgi:hypothetical protein
VDKAYVFIANPLKGNIAKIHIVSVKILGKSGELAVVKGNIKDGDKIESADEATLLKLYDGEQVYIGTSL